MWRERMTAKFEFINNWFVEREREKKKKKKKNRKQTFTCHIMSDHVLSHHDSLLAPHTLTHRNESYYRPQHHISMLHQLNNIQSKSSHSRSLHHAVYSIKWSAAQSLSGLSDYWLSHEQPSHQTMYDCTTWLAQYPASFKLQPQLLRVRTSLHHMFIHCVIQSLHHTDSACAIKPSSVPYNHCIIVSHRVMRSLHHTDSVSESHHLCHTIIAS